MDGHPFDARHTFRVNKFTDIEYFADWDEEYTEPPAEEYVPRVRQLFAVLYTVY